jgi:hypothetical protein
MTSAVQEKNKQQKAIMRNLIKDEVAENKKRDLL